MEWRGRPWSRVRRPLSRTGSPAMIAQLRDLAELRDQGVLTDAEFDAQKRKILAT